MQIGRVLMKVGRHADSADVADYNRTRIETMKRISRIIMPTDRIVGWLASACHSLDRGYPSLHIAVIPANSATQIVTLTLA